MAENALPNEYIRSEPITTEKTDQENGFLSSKQTAMVITIGLLALTMVTMSVLSSLQSSRNTKTFETSSFLTTSLADIQRETLLLSVETERYINEPNIVLDNLELRRALLANQLRVHFVQAESNHTTREHFSGYFTALGDFGRVLADMGSADPSMLPALTDQMHEVLPRLDRELKTIYDREEQSFFSVFRRSLLLQHNSERLLLVASGVITVLGVVALVSLGRTVRALKAETHERRIKEHEAQVLANESATLAEIGRIMSSSIELEDVYDTFAKEIGRLVDFDRIAISLVNAENGTCYNRYVAGMQVDGRRLNEPAPLAGTVSDLVLQNRSTMLIQDEELNDILSRLPGLRPQVESGLRSFLTVPLITKAEVIGALHLKSMAAHAFSERDVRLTEQIANQIAGTIANSQLYSERKRLQEQIVQAQKMEAIGQLAGGVAHDFNNLLTPIMGYSQMELQKNHEDQQLHNRISEIYEAAERAAGLVHQLLAFSRKQVIEPKILNTNDMVLNLEKMLKRLIGEHIELETSLAPNLGLIKADPTQVDQLIINLVVNARDALPDGGKIVVSTSNVENDSRTEMAESGQRWLRISVGDDGTGMSEEIKARIFEPFYTTKEVGQGTGLGLSTCYGIITQNGGYIDVDSEIGRGTTFHLYLPRVDDAIARGGIGDETSVMPTGSETILLVEDERAVRAFASEILQEKGYTVLEAANGEEALIVAEQQADSGIDLLLTDVVMPRMGGKELAERLVAAYPSVKVIFASGYPDNAISNQGVLQAGTVFLQKPLTPVALTKKVREVLDRV
ncbi:MAG: ATP-binding protein [Chloroflexi bacterium]|nr:ATP-binding protein [Chloroflexota bacterium]